MHSALGLAHDGDQRLERRRAVLEVDRHPREVADVQVREPGQQQAAARDVERVDLMRGPVRAPVAHDHGHGSVDAHEVSALDRLGRGGGTGGRDAHGPAAVAAGDAHVEPHDAAVGGQLDLARLAGRRRTQRRREQDEPGAAVGDRVDARGERGRALQA